MDIDNKGQWKDCFTVNGVRLPTGYYFGASAATGDLAGLYEFDDVIETFNQLENRRVNPFLK